jgi:uncharacterized protein (DUF1697 family)
MVKDICSNRSKRFVTYSSLQNIIKTKTSPPLTQRTWSTMKNINGILKT